jgi:predicted transcriptional regulator of viral defense system
MDRKRRRTQRRKQQPDHDQLFSLTSQQAGYFTAEQAKGSGFSRPLVFHHVRQGTFLRVRRGLYRLRRFPASPYEEVIAAWLGFDPEQAVVSHESALQIFDLADVVPTTIHLTVPRSHRSRRAPPDVTIHTVLKPPGHNGVVTRQGMRVSAPARAIADAAAYGTAPEQIIRAVQDALRRGLATRAELLAAARRHGGRPERLIKRAIAEVRAG